jgi:hypothetical protein
MEAAWPVDFRYSLSWPHRWWLLAMPNSPHKTLVDGRGDLQYQLAGRGSFGASRGWRYQLRWSVDEESADLDPTQQVLHDAVITTRRQRTEGGPVDLTALQTRDEVGRHLDLVRVGGSIAGGSLDLVVQTNPGLRPADRILPRTLEAAALRPLLLWDLRLGPARIVEQTEGRTHLRWNNLPRDPVWFVLPLGWPDGWWDTSEPCWPPDVDDLLRGRLEGARAFAAGHACPFPRDNEFGRFWEAAATGLFQVREKKLGRWYIEPGADGYRGYWVLDGAFMNEAMTLSGHLDAATENLELLLDQQTAAGAFTGTTMPWADGHWKETGVALWSLNRHFELSGDLAWAERVFPAVSRGVRWIRQLQEISRAEFPPSFPGRGLAPAGLGDGGLGVGVDYTNAFWLVGGLRAAATFAGYLGRPERAVWAQMAAESRAQLEAAISRDFVRTPGGGGYLPSSLGGERGTGATSGSARLQGQWGLMHAIYPLEVADPLAPEIAATITMIAEAEREDICYGIGWIADGVWTYAAGFWGLALIRAGQYAHARDVLVGYMNHATPTRCWAEEQTLRGVEPERRGGDIPHGWEWGMYLLLARSLLVFEEGARLRLLHGAHAAWCTEGLHLVDHPTRFGLLSLNVVPEGSTWRVDLLLRGDGVAPLDEVVLHAPEGTRLPTDALGGVAEGGDRISIPVDALRGGVRRLLHSSRTAAPSADQ